MHTVTIKQVKNGEYVRKVGKKKVYQRGEYCRGTKRYELIDTEDTNRVLLVPGGTLVEVGFTY